MCAQKRERKREREKPVVTTLGSQNKERNYLEQGRKGRRKKERQVEKRKR